MVMLTEDSLVNAQFALNKQEICNFYLANLHIRLTESVKVYSNKNERDESLYEAGEDRRFCWFLEHLLPINEKIRGCSIIFPDSVIFSKGKPKFIAKNDREGCLMVIKQASKLNLGDIRRTFSQVVRDRRKEVEENSHENP
jgi:hypothetical protein